MPVFGATSAPAPWVVGLPLPTGLLFGSRICIVNWSAGSRRPEPARSLRRVSDGVAGVLVKVQTTAAPARPLGLGKSREKLPPPFVVTGTSALLFVVSTHVGGWLS